jgi:hypothetical protein
LLQKESSLTLIPSFPDYSDALLDKNHEESESLSVSQPSSILSQRNDEIINIDDDDDEDDAYDDGLMVPMFLNTNCHNNNNRNSPFFIKSEKISDKNSEIEVIDLL